MKVGWLGRSRTPDIELENLPVQVVLVLKWTKNKSKQVKDDLEVLDLDA